jgi:hypothetical protein
MHMEMLGFWGKVGRRGRLIAVAAMAASLASFAGSDDLTVLLQIQQGHVTVSATVPEGLSGSRLDILSCSDLSAGRWTLAAEGLTPIDGMASWSHTAPASAVFYMVVVGDATPATDPDGDGLPSGHEMFQYGTDPQRTDTDGDGMPDGWEARHGLSATSSDGCNDPDGDGWANIEEYRRGGNPAIASAPDSGDLLKLRVSTQLE